MQQSILNFLGNGSCFNVQFGNNSAYYYDKTTQSLFLIDCGESVFKELMEQKLLEKANQIDILITHLHSDHAGSLSSLLFFCEYVKNIVPTVIYPEKQVMNHFLSGVGNEEQAYKIVTPEEYEKYKIRFVKQQHSNYINAYGYVFQIAGKTIYYSGDTKTISPTILQAFRTGKLDYFYQDVSRYETPAHLNIDKLAQLIPTNQRNKITCMHFDDEITRRKAESFGFDIAKVSTFCLER